jgi:enoyl-CoA hydratase
VSLTSLTYEKAGRVARITLDRPERGNAITLEMPGELAACVERANLDPEVHCLLLSGRGSGFCGGYDLGLFAEGGFEAGEVGARGDAGVEGEADAGGQAGVGGEPAPSGSPLDPAVQSANHDPGQAWDPVVDYQMMSRNVRGFMSLFASEKPVVCKVHGFCVAGGTDMALCSDLLVVAENAKIGYPPARVWGSPTTAMWAYRIGTQRAARLLFTGDSLSGREAAEWGLAVEAVPPGTLDERCEALVERIARVPVNQLVMMKLLLNQAAMAQGLYGTQLLGTIFDGIARHTPEGHAFRARAADAGWRQAVRGRDEPFGDHGRGPE